MTGQPSPARTVVPNDVVIVSDLHVRPPRPGADVEAARRRGGAFQRFAAAALVEASAAGRGLDLILLGDTFDLPTSSGDREEEEPGDAQEDAWAAVSVADLSRIADAHGEVMRTFAQVVAGGATVHLVTGNHDAALQLPAVEAHLRQLIGQDPRSGLAVHPWILHLPGLLYAEHGHQYHDINAFPMALQPGPLGAAVGLPLWERVESLRTARIGRRIVGSSAGLAREVGRLSLPARRSSLLSAYRRDVLPGYAEEIGLPAETLLAIDRLSHATIWSIAARLGRQLIGRVSSPRRNPGYLRTAALSIRSILDAADRGVPVYAFGHSHAPALEPLSAGLATAWYANAGSWAIVRPAELRRRLGPSRFGVVWIRPREGGSPDVRLRVWEDQAGRFGTFPG